VRALLVSLALILTTHVFAQQCRELHYNLQRYTQGTTDRWKVDSTTILINEEDGFVYILDEAGLTIFKLTARTQSDPLFETWIMQLQDPANTKPLLYSVMTFDRTNYVVTLMHGGRTVQFDNGYVKQNRR
jgi:hypothetical protein